MKRISTVVREAPQERIVTLASPRAPDLGAVEALRRRLAGTTAREHVVLDFLEDDLRETRAALNAVAGYLDEVESALAREVPTSDRLLGLARATDPAAQVDLLQEALASVRRRLSQVAARM